MKKKRNPTTGRPPDSESAPGLSGRLHSTDGFGHTSALIPAKENIMLHNTHSTLKILLLFFCAAFFSLVSPSLPLAAEDEAPAAPPSEDQRSFNERLRGLWGDAKSAGSELGSQAGEMWDSARESSSELWNDARKQGNIWADEARRRWSESGK